MQSLFLLALLGLCAGGALATGASQEVSVDSAEVRGIVGEMAEQLNGRVNSMFHRRVGNIVRASKQLVAGTLWDVDFVWGDTTCSKSRVSSYDEVTESTCPYLPKGQVEHCHVKYWVKEWENFRQIQSFNCEKAEADSLVA